MKHNGLTEFSVWAPLKKSVELHILSPEDKMIPMKKMENGYWFLSLEDSVPVEEYVYRIDADRDRPDPASFYQPKGVHGPSQVIDHFAFEWRDQEWKNRSLKSMIFYELHTGTFTPEGTFEAIIDRLNEIKELGINAIEIMPVSQFPGNRNWGYDGVYPFAVQNSYGGPEGLKKLVNACHQRGIAVVLDVVYNHLGPEGNYLWDFAPFFTERYKTPWGWALNFDGEYSEEVRNYFISNALYWFEYFHVDALRLDAIHGIYDFSANHILKEMAEKTERLSQKQGRNFYLIAESDLNDSVVINERQQNGYGIHAQWSDDFHHCLHTLLTGEKSGYYQDFGALRDLEKCLKEGYVYSGQYSPFRKRRHGNSAAHLSAEKFIVFSQNHDQVGNRMNGERLSALTDFEGLKLAAGATILFPFLPLLFMGEEYGEKAPFLYFISHGDKDLIEAVRHGRKKEFESFGWGKEPPDPYDPATFEQCILKWDKRKKEPHDILLNFYRALLRLRQSIPVFSNDQKESVIIKGIEDQQVLCLHRFQKESEILIIAHFSNETERLRIELPEGLWVKKIDSFETCWLGKKEAAAEINSRECQFEFTGFGIVLMEKTVG